MEPISQQLPASSPFNPFASNEGNLGKTQSTQVNYRLQQNTDFTLRTEEGDVVTLSSSLNIEMSYETYSSQGLLTGGAAQEGSQALSYSEQSEFSFSVDGDLNEQEERDVYDALKEIKKLANDFFSGKTDKALEHASKIVGGSIQSFEAVLQYEKNFSATQAVSPPAPAISQAPEQAPALQSPVAPMEDLPLPPAAAQPEIVASAEPETSPPGPIEPQASEPTSIPETVTEEGNSLTAPITVATSSFESSRSDKLSLLVKKITDVALDTKVEPRKIGKHIGKFLDQLIKNFERGGRMSLDKLKEAEQVKIEFSSRIEIVSSGLENESTPEPEENGDEGKEVSRIAGSLSRQLEITAGKVESESPHETEAQGNLVGQTV